MCTTVVSERPRDRPLWRGRQEHSAGQRGSLRPPEASPSSLGSREEPRELSQVEARVPPSPFLALHGRPRERNVTRGQRHWLRRSDVRRVVAAGPAAGRVRSAGEPALEPRRAFAPRAPRPALRRSALSGSLVKGQEVSERKTAQPRSPPNHRFSRHLRGPWEKEGHSSACAGTGLRGGRRHGGCTWPAPASASLGCVCAEELPDCDVPAPGPTRAAAKAARLSAGSVLTAALARA